MRTFSKIYGLAGLRVGYGICDPELADYLNRARHPFNVNRLAAAAALAALDDDEHAERSRRVNAEGVEYLTRELRALGVEVWPTDANFLLVRAGEGIFDRLQREGVIVRPLAGFGMPDCVRVTIGLPEENERLVKTLARIRGERVSAVVERVAVVGLGLLGGSVALAARSRGVAREVVGATRSAEARADGARDAARSTASLPLAEVARGADLVVLATPVGAMAAIVRAMRRTRAGCVVTDVGSVKAPLVETLPGLLPPGLPLRRLAPDGGQPPPRHVARARGPVRGRRSASSPRRPTPPRARAWWRSGRRSARAWCGAAPRSTTPRSPG